LQGFITFCRILYKMAKESGGSLYKKARYIIIFLFCMIAVPVSASSSFTSVEVYTQGQRYEFKRDFENALASYTKAIELDKNYINAYSGRARVYSWLQKFDLAIVDNSKCIELDPLNFGFYLNRGHNYMGLEEYQLAIADYSKSIELSDTFFTRKARGDAYIRTQQYELAMADFNRMARIWPRDSDVFLYRSQVYGLLGDYNNALEECKQGISIYPENSILLFNLGQCYEFMGNREVAVSYYKKALNKELAGRYYKKTALVKNKVNARIQGDWDSYSEWIYY